MGGFYLGCSGAGGPHLGPGMPRFLLHTIPRALSSPQLIFFLVDFKAFPSPLGRIELPKQFPKDPQLCCACVG